MKIGMRTIKTSIAVTVSIVLANVLELNSPFFAGIAALITMQGSVIDSFRLGRDRIFGTVLGASVGLIGSLILPGNPILIGIGTIIIIYISLLLEWKKPISIAGVVFISIMLNLEDSGQLLYSLNRIFDTFVGIMVAVLVNYFIYPPNSKDKIYKTSLELADKASEVIKAVALRQDNLRLKDMKDKLDIIEENYATLKDESKVNLNIKSEERNTDSITALSKNLWVHLEAVAALREKSTIDSANSQVIEDLYGIKTASIDKEVLAEEDIVFNYHLKQALEIINIIKAIK